MNSKIPVLEMWRRSLGMCMVCGQPMGLKGRLSNLEKLNHEENDLEEKTESLIENVIERLLLIEECPIRMAYIQFNVLGEQQDCHVVDQYTFLEKKNKEESFLFLMKKQEDVFRSLDKRKIFASFLDQVILMNPSSGILETATVNCKRLGDSMLFAGCRRCNLSMNKPNYHVDTVYRCFELTKDLDIPSLESRNVKAIKLKKLIQQIAFFFDYEMKSDETELLKWKFKESEKIMLDVNMWRCISNLCSWGTTGKFRFRMIAIFHAAVYLYERSYIKSVLKFEEWHIHVFRRLYMSTFSSGDTFFGMKETEVSIVFDLSQKRGSEWKDLVLSKLILFESMLNEMYNKAQLSKIDSFRSKIAKNVWNEKTLLHFLSEKTSIEAGTDKLLEFFKFNIQNVRERNLTDACNKFQRHLCVTYRKHLKEWISQSVHHANAEEEFES